MMPIAPESGELAESRWKADYTKMWKIWWESRCDTQIWKKQMWCELQQILRERKMGTCSWCGIRRRSSHPRWAWGPRTRQLLRFRWYAPRCTWQPTTGRQLRYPPWGRLGTPIVRASLLRWYRWSWCQRTGRPCNERSQCHGPMPCRLRFRSSMGPGGLGILPRAILVATSPPSATVCTPAPTRTCNTSSQRSNKQLVKIKFGLLTYTQCFCTTHSHLTITIPSITILDEYIGKVEDRWWITIYRFGLLTLADSSKKGDDINSCQIAFPTLESLKKNFGRFTWSHFSRFVNTSRL